MGVMKGERRRDVGSPIDGVLELWVLGVRVLRPGCVDAVTLHQYDEGYLIAHELVHLLERHHDDRFIALMNKYLPQWRRHRQEPNSAPLGHASWSY
jgi:hypothetical protein